MSVTAYGGVEDGVLPLAGRVFGGAAITVLLQIEITMVDSSMIAAFFMLSYSQCQIGCLGLAMPLNLIE
jgi:hypothetical protein